MQLHRAKGTYSWNVCAMKNTIEMHTTWSFHFDVAVKIPLSLGWCIYNKEISSVLKKQNHISQGDWPIAVFCSAFKSFLIVSQLMLCEIWCCLGPKDWSSGRELYQINILCLFQSAFCVAAFKVVLGVLDQCFRLVGCLPQTQHHKNAYYCKAPFNKGIGPALFGQEICIVYIYTSHLIGCKFSEVSLQLLCLKSFLFLWCTSVRTQCL